MPCPRCKNPVLVDIQQVFDLNNDPQAKQRLLGGSVNITQCQSCGFAGQIPTPIVYHDSEKELLLTYFPPEMGLPLMEQEKMLGPMLNKVIDGLPAEKRKAYLLQPKSMLTYQTLVESILQADGITKEMLDEQQKKVSLLQRLLTVSDSTREEVIKQEEKLIDQTFFVLLSRLVEASLGSGDQASAQKLNELQKELMEKTEIGKQIKAQSDEVEQAIKALQDAGKNGLTREKLLDVLLGVKTDLQLSTLVGLTRSGLDYAFFQSLTEKIDAAQGDEQRKLMDLRQKLLDLTADIDKKVDAELRRAREVLEKILASDDVEKTANEQLDQIDDFFVQVLRTALEDTRQRGDNIRLEKIQKLTAVIEKASAPPPEVALIEEMMAAENESDLQKIIIDNASKIDEQFLKTLNSIGIRGDDEQSKTAKAKLENVFKAVTKFAMKQNLDR